MYMLHAYNMYMHMCMYMLYMHMLWCVHERRLRLWWPRSQWPCQARSRAGATGLHDLGNPSPICTRISMCAARTHGVGSEPCGGLRMLWRVHEVAAAVVVSHSVSMPSFQIACNKTSQVRRSKE